MVLRHRAVRLLRRAALVGLVIAATLLAVRVVDSQRGPPLELWHTYVPYELHAGDLDRLEWAGYLAAEGRVFDAVRSEVTDRLDAGNRAPDNRYFADAP